MNIRLGRPFDLEYFTQRYFVSKVAIKIETEDPDSLRMDYLETGKIILESFYDERRNTSNEEYLRKIKTSKNIPLDAQMLKVLLENQDCIPDTFKHIEGSLISFDGTIFIEKDDTVNKWNPRAQDVRRYVLCLKHNHGRFIPQLFPCSTPRNSTLSAVLPKANARK